MTRSKERLEEWAKNVQEHDQVLEKYQELLGFTKSLLINHLFSTFSLYEKAVEELIVGTSVGEWLAWYRYDNDMGKKGYEATLKNGETRKIKNLDDLLWVLEN